MTAKGCHCGNPRYARGLCRSHYDKQRRRVAPLPCGGCGKCMRCAGRRGGRKGGLARAEALTAERRREISAIGGRAEADPAFRAKLYAGTEESRSTWLRRRARAAKKALERSRKEERKE